jgi:hypothetical protein
VFHVTAPRLAATPLGTGRPRRPGLTLLLLASIIVSFLAASSVPTPLYALYAAQWDFSPLATTVVFGAYALAVLASLLTFGKLSDHVGRRPVLLTALVLQAVAMVQFATAGGLETLLGARIVQGVATGALLGAAGAALLDLDRRRGALANSSAPGAGTSRTSGAAGVHGRGPDDRGDQAGIDVVDVARHGDRRRQDGAGAQQLDVRADGLLGATTWLPSRYWTHLVACPAAAITCPMSIRA